ncbi:MAG: aminoacyl-tRNA hydrolase [Candidatus Colwellbacteria bacterium]|nr:aminoacyl-tRNA hydrolase [Candidatus Colwellbacteria bacterium]
MAASSKSYKIIIGLGNPGKAYENSYHNAGYLYIDYLASTLGSPKLKLSVSKDFEYSKTANVILVKPATFMNNSGAAVTSALKRFKVKQNEILVAHDDSDISLGGYKLSIGKKSAGHNGVESIIRQLGSNDFSRLRIGVRSDKNGLRQKAGSFVLKKIGKVESAAFNKVFEEVSKLAGLS